jgi:hypothetical protein
VCHDDQLPCDELFAELDAAGVAAATVALTVVVVVSAAVLVVAFVVEAVAVVVVVVSAVVTAEAASDAVSVAVAAVAVVSVVEAVVPPAVIPKKAARPIVNAVEATATPVRELAAAWRRLPWGWGEFVVVMNPSCDPNLRVSLETSPMIRRFRKDQGVVDCTGGISERIM